MENKFEMTKEENIFVAKRNIIDYIWKSANLEGINVTFPQTSVIYEKGVLQNANVHSISVVLNLKHAWQVLLNSLNEPLSIDYFCKINYEVAKDESLDWGKLRTGKVGISGTNYIPPIPDKDNVKEQLNALMQIENQTERAIKIMFWAMKSQLFWDGNKRTAMLVANKVMIENGCGIISVPIEKIEDFNIVLSDYYTNDTLNNAVEFIYNNCIDGIEFEKIKNANL
ncbi:MAG: Fic family protein [Clostridiales bacterium]|nr:Fic family protein [Clostridiales bacterium]